MSLTTLQNWKRERRIRCVLRGLARQRVAVVLNPGNAWVIENALQRNDDVEANLQTCLMRGWVELLHEHVPTGQLGEDNQLNPSQLFTKTQTLYRLTDGGWSALNRAHAYTLANTVIAAMALVAGLLVAKI